MRIAAVLAGGVLYALALPPVDWGWCGWLALVPILLAVRAATARSSFHYGVLFGYASGWAATWCFAGTAGQYFGWPFPIAVAALSGWYLAVCGIPFGLFAVGAGVFWRTVRHPGWRIAATAALWVATEYVRAEVLGQPWGLLGYTQHTNLGLLQVATLTGVYGVSFVLAATAAAIVYLVDDAPPMPRRAIAITLVAAAVSMAVTQQWIASAGRPQEGGRSVAIVQTNIAPQPRWTRAYTDAQLAAHLRATERLAGAGHALVVWPENAVPRYLELEPLLGARLAQVATRVRADLLVGGPRLDEERTYNSARLFTAAGLHGGVYDKRKLVLFAEEQPIHFGTPTTADTPVSYAAGEGSGVLYGSLPLGVSICHEIVHPQLIRAGVRGGAEVLVNLANDGWLDGEFEFAGRQHLAMAVFRAVESRRYLVRAATTGTSAVVDPLGRIVAALQSGQTGVLSARVVPSTTLTPYARVGDAFALACVAAVLGQLAHAVAPRRRRPALVPVPVV